MPPKPKTNYKGDPININPKDLFKTPAYAVDLLVPYIPKDITLVWECANGEGNISRRLIEHGYKVLGTDIDGKNNYWNFLDKWLEFNNEKICIITNPPYSLKRQFFNKCVEYGFSFAILIPADYSQWIINSVIYGAEKIIPTRRIDYITPYDKKSSSQFHSMWLTKGFNLGRTETFVELTNQQKKENIE